MVFAWSLRCNRGVLGSFLQRDELDLGRVSMDSLEVSTFSSVVLGADDFSALVGLHSQEHLIVLWWHDSFSL